MKIPLCNGVCGKRFYCKNIDKDFCKLVPEEDEDFIECNKFKERKT